MKTIEVKTSSEIKMTKDYSLFTRLEGNRALTKARAKKIRDSIEKVGYIPVPIVVNEKMQVIDGQGRLEALKELNLPVYYIVVPGIGRDECISMNIGLENWKVMDYINSYAETGDASYTNLLSLIQKYSEKLHTRTILNVSAGTFDYVPTERIKSGQFEMSMAEYAEADNILEWLSKFNNIFNRIKGHTEHYYSALAFCYKDPEIDNCRIENKLSLRQASLIPVTTTQQALEEIEKIYNHKARTNTYIKTRYRECLEGKYPWYSVLHGDKY